MLTQLKWRWFDKLFAWQLQAQSRSGDIFIGIQYFRKLWNIINAMNLTKDLGVTSVALCGESGKLKDMVDYSINVPSTVTRWLLESYMYRSYDLCDCLKKLYLKRRVSFMHDVVILAGGFGTRLKTISGELPKPRWISLQIHFFIDLWST